MRYTTTTTVTETGKTRVHVSFASMLSPNDPRREFNLEAKLPYIKRRARQAYVAFWVEREQKTWETVEQAVIRVRESTAPLEIVAQGISPSTNLWYSITFGD